MSARKRCTEWLKSIDDAASPQDSFLEQPLHGKRARIDDDEATPRIPKAKRTRPVDVDVYVDCDDSSQTSSKRSCISRSPTKASSSINRQTNHLKAEGNYDEKLFCDLDDAALPKALVQLRDDLESLVDGTDTLPSSLRYRLENTTYMNTRRRDVFYDDQNDMYAFGEQIQDLVEEARNCRRGGEHEAGWNSAVHHPLLSLACKLSGYGEHVRAVNITDVRPQKELLPFGREIRKKMVDFGLVIRTQGPDDKLARFYHSHSFPEPTHGVGVKSWNHTKGQLLAGNPLVVSIETKQQGDKDAVAQLQLGTWASAHLKRLVELRKPISSQADRIFLPLIKIQGSHFTFLLARGDYDGTQDSLKVVLYTGMMMGDVTDYNGFFRVLACLRKIVAWIHVSYRPWLQNWTGADETGVH